MFDDSPTDPDDPLIDGEDRAAEDEDPSGGSGDNLVEGSDGEPSASGEEDRDEGSAERARDASGLIVEAEQPNNSVVVQDTLPDTMFAFPLQKSVPFPSLMMPLLLDSSAARDVAAKAEANNGYLFLVLQKDPEQEHAAAGPTISTKSA